ncbi:hypothetical protein AMECASPLE_027222 [Ameca splendens]|uniref:Uncharacterized protein n=1 Tax=Ameca splendens TaxID=208324 RepID=A0ABV0Y502_9TELE
MKGCFAKCWSPGRKTVKNIFRFQSPLGLLQTEQVQLMKSFLSFRLQPAAILFSSATKELSLLSIGLWFMCTTVSRWLTGKHSEGVVLEVNSHFDLKMHRGTRPSHI